MQFQFSFKQMNVSTALQEYAEEKIRSQVKKFVTKPIEAHVTFSVDRHRHVAHCALVSGDGFSMQVEHTCEDMYGSVDRMLDKLSVQLKRKKEKLKGHKPGRRIRKVKVKDKGEFDIDAAEIDASDIIRWEDRRKKVS